MNEVSAFVSQYGEILVFAVVLAEQIGLPLPAVPILLVAGALAGGGKIDLTGVIVLSVIACMAGDLFWYELGRRRGRRALNLLCRVSLEPDSCVRRTENFFTRHGVGSLVLAKFIPGLSTLAPALAGLFRISMQRFLLFNGLGAVSGPSHLSFPVICSATKSNDLRKRPSVWAYGWPLFSAPGLPPTSCTSTFIGSFFCANCGSPASRRRR